MSDRPTKKEFPDLKSADYERVGKMFYRIVQSSYAEKWRLYYLSIVRGFFSGLGGVIGATIGIALLIYILSFFDSVPLIDKFIRIIENEISSNK